MSDTLSRGLTLFLQHASGPPLPDASWALLQNEETFARALENSPAPKSFDTRVAAGAGLSKPPRGWVVNPELGLAECTHVRKVTVFLECDPGTDTFHGFRQPHEFFEGFAQSLLENVLNEMPWVAQVEFDAWSSVRKSGTLVQRLLDVVKSRHLLQTWGPERGWTDADEPEPRSVRNTFVPLIIAGAGVRRDALTPPL